MTRRENITETLYRFEPGESRVFTDTNPKTLRTVATRLGKSENRIYACRQLETGYYVVRIS